MTDDSEESGKEHKSNKKEAAEKVRKLFLKMGSIFS